METFNYKMPTNIYFGDRYLEDINLYIDKRKTLLITSNSMKKNVLVKRIKSLTNCILYEITDVQSHPSFSYIDSIYNNDFDFDLILAIGGGSVLDVSKVLSMSNIYNKFDSLENDIKNNKVIDGKTIPIISIPTTSGTSSEITPWATIWDTTSLKKYSLHLDSLFSETAVYSPSLTVSLSKEITISSALDCLSHSLESIWNRNANPISTTYAIKSAKLIFNHLNDLILNLDDVYLREKIMEASLYAGLAFSNTQTSVAHALSYNITSLKGIPHGIACSFTLPLLIDKAIGLYEFIDDAIIEIFGSLSSEPLRCLFSSLNISTNFRDYNISEIEEKELFSSISDNPRNKNSLIKL